jgi:hypothetical protein
MTKTAAGLVAPLALLVGSVLAGSVLTGPVLAEDVPLAHIYAQGDWDKIGDDWDCIEIASTMGWQRYMVPHEGILGRNFTYMIIHTDQQGWTVDKAQYAPVLNGGHTGADAEALAPYDKYKFDQSAPFGALMVRFADGDSRALLNEGEEPWTIGQEPQLDFRINDTGFGDNAGVLQLCFW